MQDSPEGRTFLHPSCHVPRLMVYYVVMCYSCFVYTFQPYKVNW
jgi:hypothetical protein